MPKVESLLPLPELEGAAIAVRYETDLLDTAGHRAHAATWIRQRVIVLDNTLKPPSSERARVMVHELFHFVWVRLGNPRRKEWESLLRAEWEARAKGETGWSAEWRKRELKQKDIDVRSPYWREYCCESFCDTASLIFAGSGDENSLAAKWERGRRKWFAGNIENRKLAL
jgi:hypothetical protein